MGAVVPKLVVAGPRLQLLYGVLSSASIEFWIVGSITPTFFVEIRCTFAFTILISSFSW